MLRIVKFSLVACALMALAGCQTVSNSLTADQVKSFKLVGTTVVFDPEAAIWWGDGERAYAASKGIDAAGADALAKTPAGKVYMHAQIAAKVKSAMEQKLGARLTGSRPVRVEVMVKNVTIASAAQRIIVGGTHMMQASVKLIDAQTGAVLLTHPGMLSASGAGQGLIGAAVDGMILDSAIDRVTRDFANNYGVWLMAG